MPPKNTPRRKAAQAVRELKALADPHYAASAQRFFTEPVRLMGVSAPKLRRLEREMFKGIEAEWSVAEAVAFCEIMLAKRLGEPTILAFLVLHRFADRLGPDELDRAEGWLERNLCDNWAAVDTLCPYVISPILQNHRRLIARVKSWTDSPNRWLRRASAVSFVTLARDRSFHPAIYAMAGRLIRDGEDDLVQKANGWLLREAGKVDPARLEAFLLKHRSAIPRTTVRYALERFPAAKRKRLLAATRA